MARTRSNEKGDLGFASPFALVTALCLGVFASRGASQDNLSPRDAWLQAPKLHGAHWDREAALKRLLSGAKLEGMSRTQALSLLGAPGYSAKIYPGGERTDEYRLSAANEKSFRIDYNAKGSLTGEFIEDSPCECPLCHADVPAISAAMVEKGGLPRGEFLTETITMATVEKKLGSKGEIHLVDSQAGGQMWLNYSETWRISDAPGRFLIVDGHVPLRSAPTRKIGDQPLGSWAMVSYTLECLAQ
jgi:hypothetical protein